MPKRAQMDYKRPQTAYKTLRMPSIYERTKKDEEVAARVMIQKYSKVSKKMARPKSHRKKFKKGATVELLLPKLGLWEINKDSWTVDSLLTTKHHKYVVEPSKYFYKKYIWQTTTQEWTTNGWNTTSELITIKQLAKKLSQLNKINSWKYKLMEAYVDYQGTKSLITILPPEELQAKKEKERLKRERFAEPFYNWLSN